MTKTIKLLKEISIKAENQFEEYLSSFGFIKELSKIENSIATILFRKEDQYIKLEINNHPKDYPGYFNVIFGIGQDVYPDIDFNSIAIWRFQRFIEKNNEATEYELVSGLDSIQSLVKNAFLDMQKYGKDFINSDLSMFNKIKNLPASTNF